MSLSDDAWRAFTERLFDQNAFAIKLGLDNIRRALLLEGSPEKAIPAIVVGGTNGKGSVGSAIAAILQLHGLRVGLFTSPHLIEFRERIRINGRPVSRDLVLDHGREVMGRYAHEDAQPRLTFFELTTLIAARIFAERQLDVVVWEVGLGGRLDAINAIEPALTVITNIGLDHQAYLGDTIASIASEKGALRRPDVPFILGPQTHREARDLLGHGATMVAETGTSEHENWATAELAASTYLAARFDADTTTEARKRWRWPGRLEWRTSRETSFLLDAAHNPAGVERLRAHLQAEPVDGIVVAAMVDKDLDGMFGWISHQVMTVDLGGKRAANHAQLGRALSQATIVATGNASEVFERASQRWERVAVFGSIYLLGEWFAWANITPDELVTVLPD